MTELPDVRLLDLRLLDAWGRLLIAWLVPMTVLTAALFAAARLADLVLEKRVSASWRQLLYLAVFLRLVLPLDWVSPAGLVPPSDTVAEVQVGGQRSITPGASVTSPGEAASAVAPSRASWHVLAAFVHAGGVLLLLGLAMRGRRALRRQLRDTTPLLPSPVAGVSACVHETLGPSVVGVFRPRIVLPRALVHRLDSGELSSVLRHEAAHVRRRDPLVAVLMQVALCLAWPVLPLWLAARRARALMEQACDEMAVERSDAEERKRYGELVLSIATTHGRPPDLALGLLSFGGPLAGRLRALRHRRRWPLAVQAALVIAGAGALLTGSGLRARAVVPASPSLLMPDTATSNTVTSEAGTSEEGRAPDLLLDVHVHALDRAIVTRLAPGLGRSDDDTRLAATMLDDDTASQLVRQLPDGVPAKTLRMRDAERASVGLAFFDGGGNRQQASLKLSIVARPAVVPGAAARHVGLSLVARMAPIDGTAPARTWKTSVVARDATPLYLLVPSRTPQDGGTLIVLTPDIPAPSQRARLLLDLEGEVEVRTSHERRWRRLRSDESFPAGTRLRVGDGGSVALAGDRRENVVVIPGPTIIELDDGGTQAALARRSASTRLSAERVRISRDAEGTTVTASGSETSPD